MWGVGVEGGQVIPAQDGEPSWVASPFMGLNEDIQMSPGSSRFPQEDRATESPPEPTRTSRAELPRVIPGEAEPLEDTPDGADDASDIPSDASDIGSLPDEDSFLVSREDAMALIATPVESQPRKRYVCEECGKAYSHRSGLSRHRDLHKNKGHECPKCARVLTRSDSLADHIRRHHKV